MSGLPPRADERPVFISAGKSELFGIFTTPRAGARGIAVVLLFGGVHPCFGRNQMRHRFAQELAEDGFHVLRIDFTGIGDSPGDYVPHRIDRPAVDDVRAAVAWLKTQGLERVALMGSCFGARTALASASHVDNLVAVALMSAPVNDEGHLEQKAGDVSLRSIAKKASGGSPWAALRNPHKRARAVQLVRSRLRRVGWKMRASVRGGPAEAASRLVLTQFDRLLQRDLPVLVFYGTDDDWFPDFDQARAGRLGRLLADAEPQAETVVVKARVHGFPSVAVQDETTAHLRRWINEIASGAAAPIAAASTTD